MIGVGFDPANYRQGDEYNPRSPHFDERYAADDDACDVCEQPEDECVCDVAANSVMPLCSTCGGRYEYCDCD